MDDSRMPIRESLYAVSVVIIVALALTGCRKPSRQSGSKETKKPAGRPLDAHPLASGPLPMGIGPKLSRFSLKAEGSPPLRRLRYNHRRGQRERLRLVVDVQARYHIRGQEKHLARMPRIEFDLQVAVVRQVKPGELLFSYRTVGVRMLDVHLVHPKDQAELREDMKRGGLSGWLRMDALGRVLDRDSKKPTAVSMLYRRVLDLVDLVFPSFPRLPEKPVGAGARWVRALRYRPSSPFTGPAGTRSYTLVSLKGRQGRLKEAAELLGSAPKVKTRTLEDGSKSTFMRGSAKGQMDYAFNLDRIVSAYSARMRQQTRYRIVPLAGQPYTRRLELIVQLEVRSR